MSKKEIKLESLTINVPGVPLGEPSPLMQDVLAEFRAIKHKCARINEIDGRPSSVVGLNITGDTFIKNVEIIYLQDGQKQQKQYSLQEFYSI